jgi:hypothetical protein
VADKVILGQVSLRVLRFPCRHYSTVALHTHTLSRERTIGPLVTAVQRQSHPMDMNSSNIDFTNYKGLRY